jgi:hypothetical protein
MGRKTCTTVLSWALGPGVKKKGVTEATGERDTFPDRREHGSEGACIDRRFVIGMNRIIDSQQASRCRWAMRNPCRDFIMLPGWPQQAELLATE